MPTQALIKQATSSKLNEISSAGHLDYTIWLRNAEPEHDVCQTPEDVYKKTLEDFARLAPEQPILLACICTDEGVGASLSSQFASAFQNEPYVTLSPFNVWLDSKTEDDLVYLCANRIQNYLRDENIIACYFDAANQNPNDLSEIVFAQGIAPLLLKCGISPLNPNLEAVKQYFLGGKRKPKFAEKAFSGACESLKQLLLTITEKDRIPANTTPCIRYVIRFPENCFNALCKIICDGEVPALNRVAQINSIHSPQKSAQDIVASYERGYASDKDILEIISFLSDALKENVLTDETHAELTAFLYRYSEHSVENDTEKFRSYCHKMFEKMREYCIEIPELSNVLREEHISASNQIEPKTISK